MLETLRTAREVMRSLGIYYGHRKRTAAMQKLYGHFVKPGDNVLIFAACYPLGIK